MAKSMKVTMKYSLDDEDVDVIFIYSPFFPGSRVDGFQMEPDEPADVEILSINGESMDSISKEEMFKIEEACFEHIEGLLDLDPLEPDIDW